EQQMSLTMPEHDGPPNIQAKLKHTYQMLEKSSGRTLLLFPSMEQLEQFRIASDQLAESGSYRILYEGASEISYLIDQFQNDEASVLCAVTLWEGLDIPGPALSQVIIWELPFPSNDPVFAAKRADAAHPFEEVDMPYMLL